MRIVQSKTVAGSGDASRTLSFSASPTAGNAVIVVVTGASSSASGTPPVAYGIADNQGVGNAYATAKIGYTTGPFLTAQQFVCPSIGAVSGTFTVTITAGTGENISDCAIYEVQGYEGIDQSSGTTSSTSSQTSRTLTNGAADAGLTDLVIGCFISAFDNNVAIGLTTPSGYNNTILSDPGGAKNACSICEAIVDGGSTDSATWNWSTSLSSGAAALVSYKGSANLAANATDETTGTGTLTTGIELAAAATDVTTATGVMGIYLYANAQAGMNVSAALTTAILCAAAATDATSATGVLTNFASVVLTAPLYTGVGSILDPNGSWSNGTPAAGDTVYYDPTNLTVTASGEFYCSESAFTALVQWLPSAGVVSEMVIIATPGFVAAATDSLVVSATLAAGIQLLAAAQALSNASGQLTTQIQAQGAAQALSSAIASLSTAIQAAANAVDEADASGTLTGTQNLLAAAAESGSSVQAVLNTQIVMLGAAVSLTQAAGALATRIAAAANAVSISSAIGSLQSGIPVQGGAPIVSSASAVLSTGVNLGSAATSVASAIAQLLTGIQVFSNAIGDSEVSASLSAKVLLSSAAASVAAAIGALSTLIQLAGAAQNGTSASAMLSAQTRFFAAASDASAAAAELTTRTELAADAVIASTATVAATVGAKLAADAEALSSAAADLLTFLDPDANATAEVTATGTLGAAGSDYIHPDVMLIAPPEGFWQQDGMLPYGLRYQRVGEMLIYAIDWSEWLANRWLPRAHVVPGDIVRPTRGATAEFLCIAGGYTGFSEPRWPGGDGAEVSDGDGVVWQREPLTGESLAATIQSSTWSASSPGIGFVSPRTVNDVLVMVGIDTTQAVSGTDYDIFCTITASDGRQKIGKFRLKVR